MRRLLEAWRSGDSKYCAKVLVAVGTLKVLIFLLLVQIGVTKPFIGTNAEENVFPIAERLVHEHRYNGDDSRPDSKIAPAYPFLIAGLKVAGVPAIPVVLVILQMAADTATALLLLWLGHLLSSIGTGAMAGLLWLLYPPEIVISTWMTQEPIFTALLIGSTALLIVTLTGSRSRPGLNLAGGIIMGVVTLLRATTLLIPVCLLPAWILRRRYLDVLVFGFGMYAVILPWTIRNKVVLQDDIAVATGMGNTLLQGSSVEQITSTEKKEPFYEAAAAEGVRNGLAKPNPEYGSAIDRWFMRIALMRYRQRLEQRPWSFVELLAVKSLRLWYATDTARTRMQLELALCSLPVVPLGLWQIWCWRKTNEVFFWVVGAVLAYFIGLHLVLLPLLRYMIPIYPLLLLGCSHWLCRRPSLNPAGTRQSSDSPFAVGRLRAAAE